MNTYKEQLDYLTSLVEGDTNIDWEEACRKLNLDINKDSLRKAFNTTKFSGYNVYKYFQNFQEQQLGEDEYERLAKLKDEIYKERVKLQTVNIERNRISRQDARQELFYEQVGRFIKTVEQPKLQHISSSEKTNKKYILTIADIHDGVEFVSANNEYSPKIVEKRFEILLKETVRFILEKDLSELTVLGLGDFVNGVLRANDLRANDTAVVKSCVHVSELMIHFLNTLSAYAKITYYDSILSNHSQIRYLGTKANAMMDEDLGYVIAHYIKCGLNSNNRVKVVLPKENDSFIEVTNIYDYTIFAAHGHQIKNINDVVADLSMQRHKMIDYIFMGHFHGGKEIIVNETNGNNVEVLIASSFIGSDPYSDSLYIGSKASCGIYGFDEKQGHTETYKIILN